MAAEPEVAQWRVDLTGREAQITAELSTGRWTPYGFAAVACLLAAAALFVHTWQWPIAVQIVSWLGAIVMVIAALGTAIGNGDKKAELEKIRAQLRLYQNLDRQTDSSSTSRDEDYFKNLVTINVSNLKEYYFLVKSHTRASFQTSIVAGMLGFGLVVTGLIAGYTAKTQTFTAVAAGSGILMQFIAGVFFYLYNRTVRQLKEYHDSLLDVQDVLLALKVLESVQDAAIKSDILKSVVAYLMSGGRALRAAQIRDVSNTAG